MAPSLPKIELLRLLCELRIGSGFAVEFLLALVPLFVHYARGCIHLGPRFPDPAQALQQLPAQVVDAGIPGIEFGGGVTLGQRLDVFAFTLINLGQLVVRTGQAGIETQGQAQIAFSLLVVSQLRVHQSQLVVVVSHVGLNGCVFLEFLPGPRQLLLPVVRNSQIEVDKRKFGIGLGGEVKLLDGLVILLTVDVGPCPAGDVTPESLVRFEPVRQTRAVQGRAGPTCRRQFPIRRDSSTGSKPAARAVRA